MIAKEIYYQIPKTRRHFSSTTDSYNVKALLSKFYQNNFVLEGHNSEKDGSSNS